MPDLNVRYRNSSQAEAVAEHLIPAYRARRDANEFKNVGAGDFDAIEDAISNFDSLADVEQSGPISVAPSESSEMSYIRDLNRNHLDDIRLALAANQNETLAKLGRLPVEEQQKILLDNDDYNELLVINDHSKNYVRAMQSSVANRVRTSNKFNTRTNRGIRYNRF